MIVALRELWRGRVWLARAWHLLADDGETVVLANRPGSETRLPVGPDGMRLAIPADDWSLAPGRWENWTLRVTRRGEPWSTLLFFDECGTFLSWYVNFEEPFRRSAVGFDSLDWKLDLVAFPDGRLLLKDEEQLAAAERAGLPPAAQVLGLADRVVAAPPWPTGWEERPPSPELAVATLPAGWDAA